MIILALVLSLIILFIYSSFVVASRADKFIDEENKYE